MRRALHGMIAMTCLGAAVCTGLPAGAKGARTDALSAQERANTKLVLDMWHGVIEQADVNAVLRYISPAYVQHNVNIDPGREGLVEGVKRLRNPPPGTPPHPKKQLLTAVAHGDLVVLVWNQEFPDPKAPGKAYVGQSFDMFKVRGGQIVEHWDDTRKTP